MKIPNHVLPVIVISQFLCTSLWFAGNGVMDDLISAFGLTTNVIGLLTSMVQFGFISGTLVFALLSVADKFSPSKVFLISAILGAISNFLITLEGNDYFSILCFRYLTGFFLAGIYPVGMKIASDYFREGLGKSLGYLVGALVIGTASPHLLNEIKGNLNWNFVLYTTSAFAIAGGLLVFTFIPDGPYRKPLQKFNVSALPKIFKIRPFRKAAIGYFGHMWELYTFWTFVPILLLNFSKDASNHSINIPLWSFLIIGIGSCSCVLGGYLSQRLGPKFVASAALLLSSICCITFPLILNMHTWVILLIFLLFWGMVVIADSPQLSTLVALHAPPELKGTALTIVNCIGFFITIISIILVNRLMEFQSTVLIFFILALGPIIGYIALLDKE